MTTRSARTRSAIGVTAAAVVLAGCGGGVEPVPVPVSTSRSSTTSTTPPPAPVKYAAAGLKSCPEIQQRLQVALPPLLPDTDQQGFGSASKVCTFRSDESVVVLSIQYWETTKDITGVHPGAQRAEQDFVGRGSARDKDSSVDLGSDARWRDNDTTGCTLEILDDNAVLIAHSGSRTSLADGRNEQCRGPVRELARQFYAAVQPR
ncbi:hypothetical protein [Saccharothrix variisporea]|uniref:DUF3558 domain-containing protein n=1 Tax=Saccharothrix variisporea TaxID=543527 RepID=A0A495XC68_9PSEU|nr:hypothetical protein [Saccharothrix variisporea]RKT69128.1 hypothetical protein DFJ66_2323 [Saccharothrix variisporea]